MIAGAAPLSTRRPPAPDTETTLFLSLIVALSGQANAGGLAVRVGGVDGARSVQLMALDAGLPQVSGCSDRSKPPDDRTDGIWTCEVLALAGGEVQMALAVDGVLIEVGTVVVPAQQDLDYAIQVDGSRVIVEPAGTLLAAREGLAPSGGAALVLAEVRGDFSSGAPMLRLSSGGKTVQASCGDDGRFPDRVRNDGVLGCAGPAPGDPVRVVLQVAGAAPLALGEFAAPGGVLTLSLDAEALTGTVATLPWPWPVVGAAEANHQPGPEPVPPAAGPDPVTPQPGPAPEAVFPQGPAPDSPASHQGEADRAGKGLIDALMVGLALLVGFGLAWFLPRRGPRLPQGVARVASPPLFSTGGPGLDGRAAQFRAERPLLLAAALVRRVAASRPVLVVLPSGTALPATPGAPVYSTQVRDWEEVDRQVRSLARAGGLMPAVVVVGRDTLTAPGAVAEDPAARLAERLPTGAWLGLVTSPAAATVGLLTPWEVREDDGWVLEQAVAGPVGR